jgi:hypothetical protein
MDTNATGFTSPLANAKHGNANIAAQVEFVVGTLTNVSGWTIACVVLAILVAYDQSRLLWIRSAASLLSNR